MRHRRCRSLLLARLIEEASRPTLDELLRRAGDRAGARHEPLMTRIWQLRENLTAYDAAYVALAETLDAPLLTADRRLSRIPAARCEIRLIA